MTKKEIKRYFQEEVMRLSEEGVEDLIKTHRDEELMEIAGQLYTRPIRQFLEEEESISLEVEDIPEGCLRVTAFYIWALESCYDQQILAHWQEFAGALSTSGDAIDKHIASLMYEKDLSECTICELLTEIFSVGSSIV